MECLKCGRPAEYVFHVLEVRTLHLRDIFGEKRVQALGKSLGYAVCGTCAAARLDQIRRPWRGMAKSGTPFAAALALGIILISLLPTDGNAVLRLMGPAAAICGALGLAATVRDGFRRRNEFGALPGKEALTRAAWECLLETAPIKSGDSDLTYIPIDRKTLAMKDGDLMMFYHLLPQIAAQAYGLIHCK